MRKQREGRYLPAAAEQIHRVLGSGFSGAGSAHVATVAIYPYTFSCLTAIV